MLRHPFVRARQIGRLSPELADIITERFLSDHEDFTFRDIANIAWSFCVAGHMTPQVCTVTHSYCVVHALIRKDCCCGVPQTVTICCRAVMCGQRELV